MLKQKLEIGAGGRPQKPKELWIHQDIRPLKGIEVVCDCQKLPFPDASFDEIFASHVLEHVGWRKVEATLKEWLRVLTPKGRLDIVVPDFFKLWENFITKRDLPKGSKWRGGPVDSAFVAYVTGGGQEYPENTHTAHYTSEWYLKTFQELNCNAEVIFHAPDHPSPSIEIVVTKKEVVNNEI